MALRVSLRIKLKLIDKPASNLSRIWEWEWEGKWEEKWKPHFKCEVLACLPPTNFYP